MGQIAGSQILKGSLWIRPTGPALATFQQAIQRIQERVGGPGCQAHLTLLGGITMRRDEAERRLKELAASFQPFPIGTGRIDWYHEYYRAFFVRAEASDELLAAHRRARELFGQSPRDPYEPHVSLYYGELDEARKKQLAADLGGAIDLEFQAQSVHLVNATASVPVEQWRSLAECDFSYRDLASGRGATFLRASQS